MQQADLWQRSCLRPCNFPSKSDECGGQGARHFNDKSIGESFYCLNGFESLVYDSLLISGHIIFIILFIGCIKFYLFLSIKLDGVHKLFVLMANIYKKFRHLT